MLLLCHVILQCGHLNMQPGLMDKARVQLKGFKYEPGHPDKVIPVLGPLWGWGQLPGAEGGLRPSALENTHMHMLTSHTQEYACVHTGTLTTFTCTHTQGRHTHTQK